MKTIRVVGKHVYLNEHDIGSFVSKVEKIDTETLVVTLKGSVQVEAEKKAKPGPKRKKQPRVKKLSEITETGVDPSVPKGEEG
jgi:hypothetical protein